MSQLPGFLGQLPPLPDIDYSVFGEVEQVPLARIQKLTAAFLTRNWVSIPHVTHHDEADITELLALRERLKADGISITPLAFQLKALALTLKEYPQFNASLDANGENLILKKYYHLGFAVDTPKGLLVAVIRDCEQKGARQIAEEIRELSMRARNKGLPMKDMQGGCMTISALGSFGGTAFTPIINAPEVAILGVTKAQWQPKRAKDDGIDWRMMVPLDLSYDHRVINGADAAKFLNRFAALLGNPEALL